MSMERGLPYAIEVPRPERGSVEEENPRGVVDLELTPEHRLRIYDMRGVKPDAMVDGKPMLNLGGGAFVNLSARLPFIIVGTSKSGNMEARGLWSDGREVVIGRKDERFDLADDSISREHLKIHVDEGENLVITDTSLNGTKMKNLQSVERANSLDAVDSQSHEQDDRSLEQFSDRIQMLATPLDTNHLGEVASAGVEEHVPDSYFSQPFDISDEGARRNSDLYLKQRREDASNDKMGDRNKVSRFDVEFSRRILDELIRKDETFASIVDNYAESANIMDELRLNHTLRCAVIEYFMQKLSDIRQQNPEILPERVIWNSPNNLKSLNHNGYKELDEKKLTSGEYTALLALAKIDGSFDSSRADATQSHINHDGTPGYGQHRTAADTLLWTLMKLN